MRSFFAIGFLVYLLSSLLPNPAWAGWPVDGVGLSTSPDDQLYPKIVSDGAGGAIVIWSDYRSGTGDVYAQRVDASGNPLWTADGVALCTAADTQNNPAIVSDGAGGAIIAWKDFRSDTSDIYVQRVDATGNPLWTADGVALCTAANSQIYPSIVSDGAGGAIVAWGDERSGSYPNIYAQRVDASGNPLWTADGVALRNRPYYDAMVPVLAPDGAGGAIVSWYDNRAGGSYYDIYAQRVDASGNPLWTVDGVALCTQPYGQMGQVIVSDGAGGAIVVWCDNRDGDGDGDLYMQRVDASGNPQWTADGVALCTLDGLQENLAIVSDGASGAIVTWDDYRGEYADIYVQRVDASGNPQWTADGVALCTAAHLQRMPTIAPDGAGGAVVAWHDYRTFPTGGTADIYAQRVDASGVPQWAADGVALCTAEHKQLNPTIASNGAGNSIVAWHDYRGSTDVADIYAQRVESVATGVGDTPAVTGLAVLPSYPNPFAATTEFRIWIPVDADITVDIYDVAGRHVSRVGARGGAAGWNRLTFAGRDEAGRRLPSGVYFYSVRAGGEVVTRKMVITR